MQKTENIKLVAVICRPGSPKSGKDLGEILGCKETGIRIIGADRLEEMVFRAKPDIVVDFSKAGATIRNAAVLSRLKVNMVIATTGFSDFSLKRLYVLAKKNHSGILYAPNITLGVNVMMLLTNIATSILSNCDFQVTEEHHNRKADIPSGTALKIAGEIEKALKASGADVVPGTIPINAVRAGGIIGKHEVIIAGDQDMLEISHQSFSRKAFAEGAIRCLNFIYKKAGYFEMSDVLRLGDVLSKYIERDKRHRPLKNAGLTDTASS